MKTYLIQRAKFEQRNFKSGIDSIIKLDYMGAAEFEFGALPKSLRAIRDCLYDYVYIEYDIKGKSITVFCKESQINDIKQYLNDLADGKMSLHEYSSFDSYVNPSKYDEQWAAKHGHNVDFWWDIQNNLMFWKTNNDFKAKFEVLIDNK